MILAGFVTVFTALCLSGCVSNPETEGEGTKVGIKQNEEQNFRQESPDPAQPSPIEIWIASAPLHILQDKAVECFDQATRCQVQAGLAYLSLTPEVEKDMTEFAVEINRQYFAGTLSDDDREKRMQSQGWKLWKEKGKDTFWYVYLNSILNE